VLFRSQPEDTVPLTLAHDVLLQLLDAEQPRTLPDTGTNIGDAVAWGLKKLDAAGGGRQVLVLLSDGEHNVPAPALTPRQAGQLAANRGVTVYTIDAGGPPLPGAPPEDVQARGLGRKALEAVAALTGGRAFAAHDASGLMAGVG